MASNVIFFSHNPPHYYVAAGGVIWCHLPPQLATIRHVSQKLLRYVFRNKYLKKKVFLIDSFINTDTNEHIVKINSEHNYGQSIELEIEA